VGLIPWEEIVEIRAHRYPLFGSSLAIWLLDPQRVLGRKGRFARGLIADAVRRNLLLGWGNEPLPALNLDWRLVEGDVEAFVDQIRAEYPLVLRAYGIVVRRDPRREH
jgi:hypothetical protein